MSVNLRQLVKESTLEVLQEDLTATVDEGHKVESIKRLLIAGILLWSTLTQDGRDAVKQAYKALQINSPVPVRAYQQIQDEVPYTGAELDQFIQDQGERVDRINKELGPVSQKILKSPYFVRDEPTKEGFDPTSAGPNPEATEGTQNNPYPRWNAEMRKMEESDPHGRYAQEAGAGEFDNRIFGVNEYSLPENEPEPTAKEKLEKLIHFLTRVHSVCETIPPEDQIKLNRCLDELAGVIQSYD